MTIYFLHCKMRMKMTLVHLLIQPRKKHASHCVRCLCHSALFNGFQNWIKNEERVPKHNQQLHPPSISWCVSCVSSQNIQCRSYSYPICANSPARKLSTLCSFPNFHKSLYHESSGDSARRVYLIKKINDGLGLSDSARKSTRLSKTSIEMLSPYENSESVTLEKKLLYLMEFWELDDAIFLLKNAIARGEKPDRTVILNMLQQIATLGKIECLQDLYDTILKENGLVSTPKFFQCLGTAVSTSGRLTEGMAILTQKYQAGASPGDVDTLFTILATDIIKSFEHHYHLVEEFVEILLSREPPILPARAMLWKCFVLSGKFDEADELRSKHDLKKLVPEQVSSINHMSPSNSHMEFDRETVLLWIIQQPYLKSRLRAYSLHMLIQLKCEEKEWGKVIRFLSVAMDTNIEPQQETLINFLSVFFDECTEEEELLFWKSIGDNLKTDEIRFDTDGENDDKISK